MTETCRTCGETKPIEEFDVRADTGKRERSARRVGVLVSVSRSLPRSGAPHTSSARLRL